MLDMQHDHLPRGASHDHASTHNEKQAICMQLQRTHQTRLAGNKICCGTVLWALAACAQALDGIVDV
jgi:hypothetical protein